VPQAVLKFKQGFGRLIRTKNDRGAIVVLDRRIKSKYYGAAFLYRDGQTVGKALLGLKLESTSGGTASVTQVLCQANGGPWTPAQGTHCWQADVQAPLLDCLCW
jgi:hypothetical protein